MLQNALRVSIVSALFILSTVLPATLYGQFLEDFENGEKGAYASGTVDLTTGTWILDDALLGSGSGDRINGSQSVRLRNGFIEMQFDYPDGSSVFSFYGANSGYSGDTGGVVSVYFSTDGGENWTILEQDIELTEENSLQRYEIFTDIDSPVRFRIEKTGDNRVNIDDVAIEPYTELSDEPEISLRSDGEVIEANQLLPLPATQINQSVTREFRITNEGNESLEISSVSFDNTTKYSVIGSLPGSLESRESALFTVQFQSGEHGTFGGNLTINTNDPDDPSFTVTFEAFSVDEDVLIPIRLARDLPFGIRVKVAGLVSVANEFEGPSFIQSDQAGIAVFHQPLSETVSRGDSVHVQGPLTEFNPIDGPEGDFLLQIASQGNDSPVTFTVAGGQTSIPEPEIVTLADINSGNYESRLITLNDVTFLENGFFRGDQNVSISDETGFGQVRIDNSVDELIGGRIPEGETNVTGVVDKFNGQYQIKPRDSDDLEVETIEYGGEDVPKDSTLDVVTWNVEWFGSDNTGPEPDLQISNVIEVVETIDADLYAFQEISNRGRFFEMADNLEDYRGFVSFYSQEQQTAYLFKSSVIDSLDSGELREGQDDFDWASGRFPLFFEFNATIGEKTQRITSYNFHAKAFGDRSSYNRRKSAAESLKSYLDQNKSNENVIILGDFNDQLTSSTYDQEDSPYTIFIEDENYYAVTKSLEEDGFVSFIGNEFRTMIDHIMVTNALIEGHINNAQRVEDTSYIENYISTTSDHLPVWSRFRLTQNNGQEPVEPTDPQDEPLIVYQNYPNPFQDQTTIRFSLKENASAEITIFNATGRVVGRVSSEGALRPGTNEISFDGSGLSSGLYIYQIKLDTGDTETGKMVLVN